MAKANRNQSLSERTKQTASRFRFGAYASSLLLVGGLLLAACSGSGGGSGSSGSSGSGSGGGGSTCSTGFCLNNGQCCRSGTPYYTYGGHGYAAGCYASCPYVGDCGSRTQCF